MVCQFMSGSNLFVSSTVKLLILSFICEMKLKSQLVIAVVLFIV